jgi:hypothetical protein
LSWVRLANSKAVLVLDEFSCSLIQIVFCFIVKVNTYVAVKTSNATSISASSLFLLDKLGKKKRECTNHHGVRNARDSGYELFYTQWRKRRILKKNFDDYTLGIIGLFFPRETKLHQSQQGVPSVPLTPSCLVGGDFWRKVVRH